MRFERGQSGNPSGRPKGAKGRTSEQLRELIRDFLETSLPEIQDLYDKLEPKDQIRFIDAMLKYVIPPPIHPEKLNIDQLQQILQYLKENEQQKIN